MTTGRMGTRPGGQALTLTCISTSGWCGNLNLLIAVAPNEVASDEPVDLADGRPER